MRRKIRFIDWLKPDKSIWSTFILLNLTTPTYFQHLGILEPKNIIYTDNSLIFIPLFHLLSLFTHYPCSNFHIIADVFLRSCLVSLLLGLLETFDRW